MILIWGFRNRAKKTGSGEFFCTRCGADRSYVLQAVRRWFTFFFIPLFPVGKALDEHVRCTTCGTAFRPEVLDTPTSVQFSENLRGATRVASVAMLVAGDPASAPARAVVIDAMQRMGADKYDETWLNHDLAALDASQVRAYVAPLEAGLNPQGKESFVEQIARVGLADGPLTPGEMRVLESVAAGVGVSAAHLRGIVVTMTSAPQPSDPDPRDG
jgi:hypothetical protein